jgi:hypothetical protein
LAELGNPISGITGNALEHWWVEIETANDSRWFILQFGGKRSGGQKYLELSEFRSRSACNERGVLTEDKDKRIFTLKSIDTSSYRLTMDNIYDWAKRFDSRYGLLSNNCQDLVNKFFIEYFSVLAHDPEKAMWEGLDTVATTADIVTTIVGVASGGDCCVQ